MFIDPNFETMSGEFLVTELWARASGEGPRSACAFNRLRWLWRWAAQALAARRAGARL